MNPALLSLLALGFVIVASFGTRVNVGVLAIALAWPVAVYGAEWSAARVLGVFPASLFLTLVGVTLLFGVAQVNGTLAQLTERAMRRTGSGGARLPLLFFVLTGLISTLGPGAIAATALMAPLAMGAGARAGLPPLLTALMVANGANAGNLSPFSAVGVIVDDGMVRAGLPGHAWSVWSANFVAHALAATAAWWLFGRARRDPGPVDAPASRAASASAPTEPLAVDRGSSIPASSTPVAFTRAQTETLLALLAWVIGVVVFDLHLGLAGFTVAALLLVRHAAVEAEVLRAVPWAVIVMVCGVSVLIGVLDGTGGMALFTSLLARIATPDTVNGVIAFVTGAISTYSSTSGVVYPTFLPTIPGLVAQLGGGDPLEIALSINVGAALVDVSPLSTLGALCIAALPRGTDPQPLFRALLTWGMAMTVVGAVFALVLVPLFAR
jgi:di/tricarboxylate transporter